MMRPTSIESASRPAAVDYSNLTLLGDSAQPSIETFDFHLQSTKSAPQPTSAEIKPKEKEPEERKSEDEPGTLVNPGATQPTTQATKTPQQAEQSGEGDRVGETDPDGEPKTESEAKALLERAKKQSRVAKGASGSAEETRELEVRGTPLEVSDTAETDGTGDEATTTDSVDPTTQTVELEVPGELLNAGSKFADEDLSVDETEQEGNSAKGKTRPKKGSVEVKTSGLDLQVDQATTIQTPNGEGSSDASAEDGSTKTQLPAIKKLRNPKGASAEKIKEPEAEVLVEIPKAEVQQPTPPVEVVQAFETQSSSAAAQPQVADLQVQVDQINSPGASSAPATRIAQHLLVHGDEHESKAMPLSGPDQARLLDRVSRAFRSAEKGDGSIRLRLHPPELGSVRIEVKLENGVMSARLEAETPTAQAVLLDHSQMLRDRLAEQGVRVERFDVELMDQRFSENSSSSSDQRMTHEHSNGRRRQPELPIHSTEKASGTAPRILAGPGNLNVII